MKHIFKLFLIVFAAQFISSCNYLPGNNKPENLSVEDDFSPVEINHEYSIDIPKYIKPATDLNDVASLQYQNIFKETYIIIIDELKSEVDTAFRTAGVYNDSISMVKNYRNVQLQLLGEKINVSNEPEPKALQINGLDAESVEMEGTVSGITEPVAYWLTFVEGKDKVYMIMTWTLLKSKDKYSDTFEKMAQSFKML